jgi:DNA-binding MarR family transcriptional regulator
MSGKLLRELHKVRPFDSIEQEVVLNVIRTADHFSRAFEELLKPFNLSATQYNVLRILRGISQNHECCNGVPCKTIGEHMVTRDPDITRLLDRLETRGLITRQRDTKDRRIVSTRITAEGLGILEQLDKPVLELHRRQFAHMPEAKIAQLIDLLEQARTGEAVAD